MWASKLDTVRRTHGSALAMRLATEKIMFSESHRLPGLKSSRVAHDTLMGTDNSIDFADFLNVPSMRPEMPRVTLHDIMESKLRL